MSAGGRDGRAEVLDRLVHAAVAEVPGADLAGVTVLGRDGPTSPACSADLVVAIDMLQYGIGEGPCLSAARLGTVVRCDDLRTDERWPRFGPRAAELGVRSMLSVRMYADTDAVGALNLYARWTGGFPRGAEAVAVPLAMAAADALAATWR